MELTFPLILGGATGTELQKARVRRGKLPGSLDSGASGRDPGDPAGLC